MSWRADWGNPEIVKITYDPDARGLAEQLQATWDALRLWPPPDLTPEFDLFLTRIPAMSDTPKEGCACERCQVAKREWDEEAERAERYTAAGALNGQRKAHPLSPLTNHEIMCSCADFVARFDNYKREAITIGTCGIDPAAQQGRDMRLAMAADGPAPAADPTRCIVSIDNGPKFQLTEGVRLTFELVGGKLLADIKSDW